MTSQGHVAVDTCGVNTGLRRKGKMAKNKQKGKKVKNVFQVDVKYVKPKNKPKPVKTSLKHMNALKNEKVEKLNKIFSQVQQDVKNISKPLSPEPTQVKVVQVQEQECVNVEDAAQLFSQL